MTANNKKHAANNKNKKNKHINKLNTIENLERWTRLTSTKITSNPPAPAVRNSNVPYELCRPFAKRATPLTAVARVLLVGSRSLKESDPSRLQRNLQSLNVMMSLGAKWWIQSTFCWRVSLYPPTVIQPKVRWRYYKIIQLLVESVSVCVRYSFPFHPANSKEWPPKDLALNFSSSTFSFFQDSLCFISCFTTKCLRSRTGKEGFDGIIDWWFTHVDPLGQNIKQQTAKTWNKLIQLKLITTCYFSFKVVSELHQQISSRKGQLPPITPV